jgi:hypothetical protein
MRQISRPLTSRGVMRASRNSEMGTRDRAADFVSTGNRSIGGFSDMLAALARN